MKAFLLYDDNGSPYEDYQEWVTHVLLVPDDFDPNADQIASYQRLCPASWLLKNGWARHDRADKAYALYKDDLISRFQSIPLHPFQIR